MFRCEFPTKIPLTYFVRSKVPVRQVLSSEILSEGITVPGKRLGVGTIDDAAMQVPEGLSRSLGSAD